MQLRTMRVFKADAPQKKPTEGRASMASPRLPFEEDIHRMEELLAQLEATAGGQMEISEEIRRIRREIVARLAREIQ